MQEQKILLVTPPMVQINSPYAATPVLSGFLRQRGYAVTQCDLSAQLAAKLFSSELIKEMGIKVNSSKKLRRSEIGDFFLSYYEDYLETIDAAVDFLKGKAPELQKYFLKRDSLPEGINFYNFADELKRAKQSLSPANYARMRVSLFLDDVAELFQQIMDESFQISRYAEKISANAICFDELYERSCLHSNLEKATYSEHLAFKMLKERIEKEKPTHIGFTLPFPGTVSMALVLSALVKKHYPEIKIVIGGGFVNSELRDLTEERIFEFVDYICYDEGFAPWQGVLGEHGLVRTCTSTGYHNELVAGSAYTKYQVIEPDYTGIDFENYIPMYESINPMHNLWSDRVWLKLQLTNGCYWHKCAFCDVALDYIGNFCCCDASQAADVVEQLIKKTGKRDFHFTDEAIPPVLARELSKEFISRGLKLAWWGNIRFDKGFSDEVCKLMAQSGCVAISAGLECAQERLLKLMNKGITLESARETCRALKSAGIMVHAYLMYDFPTETEEETLEALTNVRDMFADGLLDSAFWHRFALTVHSPIAANPSAFGITPDPNPRPNKLFALNEISYLEQDKPYIHRLGEALRVATHNYMAGNGFEYPAKFWLNLNFSN